VPDTQADRTLRVIGGSPLRGRVRISGSKNASLPIMAATLLTHEPVVLRNVPRIIDTAVMGEILCALGGSMDQQGDGRLVLRSDSLTGEVTPELGRRMRASIVLLGPLVARVGMARLPRPGGDSIGARRVEQHLRGLRAMGAEITETATEFIATASSRLHGARIVLDLPTVTGTENLIMAATLAEGRTEIINAAREPHVRDLCRCLTKMGADIRGSGTDEIVVYGGRRLRGTEHRVVPDYLEAGTFALAVAAAGGDVVLEDSPPQDLTQVLLKLEQAGADVETRTAEIRVRRSTERPLVPVDMVTWVHPGFPTDLQGQYMALMTRAAGETVISEYLFENRFHHVPELHRMGAEIRVHGRDALVQGPAPLRGSEVAVSDIRSGAALVIAALCADGTSELRNAWHIDRGYQDLVGKLTALGASIELSERRAAPEPAAALSSFE
jgi:UDP-N-acetylglucosamine 1-carboxyvinyltransferase